jgi:hypothetical protein
LCTYYRNHDNNSSSNAVVDILTWISFMLVQFSDGAMSARD